MARIAIGGFQHETNTFSPHKADLEAFQTVSAYPRMPRGKAIFEQMSDLNVSIGGFIKAAQADGHELLPTLWATAVPSAHVSDEAFEHITGIIVEDLRAQLPVDAVYLCLHGAMVTESYEDGEAEVLRRVREVIGADVPLVASLDLHSNTTVQMMEHSDALVAYRTYPHVDMAVTGRRTYDMLAQILRTGKRPAKALRRSPFLIPLVAQCSMIEPAARIYADFEARQTGDVYSVSFTPGFPPADIHECGPTVLAYGADQATADAAADAILAEVVGARAQWAVELLSPDAAVARAMSGYQGKPFVLADTQDNPGAGGASDTVGLLEALIRLDAQDAVFAALYEPEAARAAHAAGVGARLELTLGGASGTHFTGPVTAEFTVEAIGDGQFVGTGPMAVGAHYNMGLCARLSHGGVQVMIASGRSQVLDQAILRHVGIEPSAQKILGIKSSVHFRADFQPLAEAVLVVVAPGPNLADNRDFAYHNLRDGLEIMP